MQPFVLNLSKHERHIAIDRLRPDGFTFCDVEVMQMSGRQFGNSAIRQVNEDISLNLCVRGISCQATSEFIR